jgi:hypothetical protein
VHCGGVVLKEEEVALVCARVKDLPRPHVPSMRLRCGDCGLLVWAANDRLDRLPKGHLIFCTVCAVDRIRSN